MLALLLLLAPQPAAAEPKVYDAMADVARVFAAVLSEHVKGIEPSELARRAIDGMLGGLDAHTRRIEPAAQAANSPLGCLVDRGVLHLTVSTFMDRRQNDWLRDCADLRAGRPLLLDLRGNTGGRIASALALADLLVGEAALFKEQRRDGVVEHRSTARHLDVPGIVVAIDGGTASAAELLAMALRDHGRALVVGQRSRGKLTVQTPIFLSDGSVALITTGRVTPTPGAAAGIVPDQAFPANAAAVACAHARGRWRQNRCGLATE